MRGALHGVDAFGSVAQAAHRTRDEAGAEPRPRSRGKRRSFPLVPTRARSSGPPQIAVMLLPSSVAPARGRPVDVHPAPARSGARLEAQVSDRRSEVEVDARPATVSIATSADGTGKLPREPSMESAGTKNRPSGARSATRRRAGNAVGLPSHSARPPASSSGRARAVGGAGSGAAGGPALRGRAMVAGAQASAAGRRLRGGRAVHRVHELGGGQRQGAGPVLGRERAEIDGRLAPGACHRDRDARGGFVATDRDAVGGRAGGAALAHQDLDLELHARRQAGDDRLGAARVLDPQARTTAAASARAPAAHRNAIAAARARGPRIGNSARAGAYSRPA